MAWRRIKNGYEFICWLEGTKTRCQRYHRRVWEEAHGTIPPGHVIHHKDGNRLNNAIENLECLPNTKHADNHNPRERSATIDGRVMWKCSACGEYKAADDYYRAGNGSPQAYCKTCAAVRLHQWREENKERWAAYMRDWYQRNREHDLSRRREHDRTHEDDKAMAPNP